MHPIIEVIRIETGEQGTFGVLLLQKQIHGFTLEPPARGNKPNVSSIPAGQYLCLPYRSARYGETLIVSNVPDRSSILFHPGNVAEDTQGCIILGSSIGKLRADRAVLNSGATFATFMKLMAHHEIAHLTIREAY